MLAMDGGRAIHEDHIASWLPSQPSGRATRTIKEDGHATVTQLSVKGRCFLQMLFVDSLEGTRTALLQGTAPHTMAQWAHEHTAGDSRQDRLLVLKHISALGSSFHLNPSKGTEDC